MVRSGRLAVSLTFLLALTAVSLLVPRALADSRNGTLVVNPGTLSVEAPSVISFTLDGAPTAATGVSPDNAIIVTDSRGSGTGWHLSITARDTGEDGHRLQIRLLDARVTTVAGNTAPSSLVTSLTPIPTGGAPALNFVSGAQDTAMGTYVLVPEFELQVSADTDVETGAYPATVLISVESGP